MYGGKRGVEEVVEDVCSGLLLLLGRNWLGGVNKVHSKYVSVYLTHTHTLEIESEILGRAIFTRASAHGCVCERW